MLKIISTIGFLVTLVLFLNSDITVEILFIINIFFVIIFFYKPTSIPRTSQKNNFKVVIKKNNNFLNIFFNIKND